MRNFSFTIVVYFLLFLLAGIYILPLLGVEKESRTQEKSIQVSFSMRNCSAKIVEREVTSILEAELSQLTDLSGIESVSENENGSIKLIFNEKTDIETARLEVSTIIRRLWHQLPSAVSYPKISIPPTSTPKELKSLECWIYGPLHISELKELSFHKILPRLKSQQGVASVSVSEDKDTKYSFVYNDMHLQSLGLSEKDISKALSNHFQSMELGTIQLEKDGKPTYSPVYSNVHVKMDSTWQSIPIYRSDSTFIAMRDLVELKGSSEHKKFRINGHNATKITITADSKIHIISLQDQLKKEISEISQDLPKDVGLLLKSEELETLQADILQSLFITLFAASILLILVYAHSRNKRHVFIMLASFLECLFIYILIFYLSGKQLHSATIHQLPLSMTVLTGCLLLLKGFSSSLRNKKRTFTMAAYIMMVAVSLYILLLFLQDFQNHYLLEFIHSLLIVLPAVFLVSEFFLPALCQVTKIKNIRKPCRFKTITIYYQRWIEIILKYKKICLVIAILLLGVPTFLLPTTIDSKSSFAEFYNSVNQEYWIKKTRAVVDQILGGTMKQFAENKPKHRQHTTENKKTHKIYIKVSTPIGTTFDDLHSTIQKMESFLKQQKGIKYFETSIHTNHSAHIVAEVSPEIIQQKIDAHIFDDIVKYAIHLGNANWSIHGMGHEFDNHILQESGNEYFRLYGYNYDMLMDYAETLKKKLETHDRVRNIKILSDSKKGEEQDEYVLIPDYQYLILNNIHLSSIYSSMKPHEYSTVGHVVEENGDKSSVLLIPENREDHHYWTFMNQMNYIHETPQKIKDLVTKVDKQSVPLKIERKNQEYALQLNYSYVGAPELARFIQKEVQDEISNELKPGFRVDVPWELASQQEKSHHQWYVLVLIPITIFLMGTVIFNSFKWACTLILFVVFSSIGVMGGGWMGGVPFNSSSSAAFILVSTLSIIMGISVIIRYRIFLKRTGNRVMAYVKTMHTLLKPVTSVFIYSMTACLPFLFISENTSFEYQLSCCMMGGMVFVFIGVFFFIPVLLSDQ